MFVWELGGSTGECTQKTAPVMEEGNRLGKSSWTVILHLNLAKQMWNSRLEIALQCSHKMRLWALYLSPSVNQ